MNVPEITVAEFAEMRRAGTAHVLLDVREDDELRRAALPEALHIPMGDVPARLSDIPSDTPLVVMCHHGGRSARVTAFLRENGYPSATNLEGGIDAWSREVDPAVLRY